MKSKNMERADDRGGNRPEETARYGIAIGAACVVHAILFSIFNFAPEKPLAIPARPIPVQLVILEAAPPSQSEASEEIPVEPEPKPPPLQQPPPAPSAVPDPVDPPREQPLAETLPQPAPTAPLQSAPLSIISTEDPQVGEPIPDRWRLPDGARIPLENTQQTRNSNLEALSEALDCLGFDADCAVQRKVIFAEDQLTGTDLVWMRSYAHSGLSDSDLFGLSEAQIRERLGIPTAGKNGFMLLPGIAIDGPWWDALHGVNKACEYGFGINDLGQKQLMKRCKPLKPTSKDEIGFMPKLGE